MHTGLARMGAKAEMGCSAMGWGWGIEGGGDGGSRSAVQMWYPVLVSTEMEALPLLNLRINTILNPVNNY